MATPSKSFELIATDPESWLSQAEQHLYAARLIADHFGTIAFRSQTEAGIRVAKLASIKSLSLLLAFVLENALKALIIASNASVVKNGRIYRSEFDGGKSGHDLVALSKRANLPGRTEQQDLFRRLTVFAEWAGRYPLPLTETTYKDSSGNVTFNWRSDLVLVESTLKEIADKLRQ